MSRPPFHSLPFSSSTEEAANALPGKFSAMMESDHEAAVWLDALQVSREAWDVTLHVLSGSLESPPSESVLLLCSQMLSNKIQIQFHEVPSEEDRAGLRGQLMRLLHEYASGMEGSELGDKIVGRLCIALANVAVQDFAWESPISDVVESFGEVSVGVGFAVVLQFLTVLPEQVRDPRIPIIFSRKTALAVYMENTSSNVLDLLHQFLEAASGSIDAYTAVLAAFQSWLRVGEFPHGPLLESQLLELTFQAVREDSLVEPALVTLIELVRFATTMGTEPETTLGLAILDNILDLEDMLERAMNADETGFPYADEWIRLFIQASEDYTIAALNANEGALRLVDVALAVTTQLSLPQDLFELAIGFWFTFTEELLGEHAHLDALAAAFADKYASLLTTLVARSAFPAHTDPMHDNAEEVDGFLMFRDRITSKSIVDVCLVLGGESVLLNLCELLRSLPEVTQGPGDTVIGWEPIEAVLFAVNVSAEYVSNDEDELLPALLPWLLELPLHQRLTTTTMFVLSSYASWLLYHPEHLDGIVKFLVAQVSVPGLAEPAATTLKCICDDCALHLTDDIGEFIQLFDASFDASVSAETRAELLRSAGFIISEMEAPQAIASMQQVYEPIQARIIDACKIIDASSSDVDEALAELKHLLSLVHALVRSSYVSQIKYKGAEVLPGVAFMRTSWPLISSVLELCMSYEPVCESICDGIIKYTIRATKDEFIEFLEPVLDAMLGCYQQYPFSCYLYVANLVASRFSTVGQLQGMLLDKIDMFSSTTLALLGQPNGFQAHPYVVMEYYEMIVTVMRRVPRLIVTKERLPILVQCSLEGLRMDHMLACKACLAFVEHVLQTTLDSALGEPLDNDAKTFVYQVIGETGPAIVEALVAAIVNKIELLKDVLINVVHNFLMVDVHNFSTWMFDVLDTIPEELVTRQNKTELMEQLAQSSSRTQVAFVIQELAVLYRMRAEANR